MGKLNLSIIGAVFVLSGLAVGTEPVEAKTRLSVTEFENKAGRSSCRTYWSSPLGSAFKEMLVTKLTNNPRFEILEREHIRKIYNQEHDLINSGNVKKPKKGQFKVAHFTIAGAVSEFELCNAGGGGSVDVGKLIGFGSMDVGLKIAKAKVAVDVRVIDVETGSLLSSIRGSGSKTSKGFDIDAFFDRADFDVGAFHNSPLGAATREAIENATEELIQAIPDRKDPVAKASSQVGTAQNGGSGVENTIDLDDRNLPVAKYIVCRNYKPSNRSGCYGAKLLNKSDDGSKYLALEIGNGERSWVAKPRIRRLARLENKPTYVGETVAISYSLLRGYGDKLDLAICTVTQILGDKASVSCGTTKKVVAITDFHVFPKYRDRERAQIAKKIDFEKDFE